MILAVILIFVIYKKRFVIKKQCIWRWRRTKFAVMNINAPREKEPEVVKPIFQIPELQGLCLRVRILLYSKYLFFALQAGI